MKTSSLGKSLRIAQIRLFVFVLNVLGHSSAGARFIVRCRRSRLARSLLDLLVGYRRTFSSFTEARDCARRYIPAGHEHPDDIRFHTSIAGTLRESDYPALFYLAPVASDLHRVYDLGGNVGNLFYTYEKHLRFPADLQWWIYDLPEKMLFGEKLARERNERRIRFTDQLAAASGADLFISSGSLHYFDEPLAQMLRQLPVLPRQIIVNRTPCSKGEDLFTVQDNRSYLVPCKIHGRAIFIQGMQEIGYVLRAEWPVYERKLWVPLHPDHSIDHYNGFYFERV